MSDVQARELVALLCSRILRCRTGILLLAPEDSGRETEIAARLGVDAVDYAQVLRESLPPGASFPDIGSEREEARLDALCDRADLGDCVLVYNLHSALEQVHLQDRARFWTNLRDWFPHRRRALLLAMPLEAEQFLPGGEERETWHEGNRIAGTADEVGPDLKLEE